MLLILPVVTLSPELVIITAARVHIVVEEV